MEWDYAQMTHEAALCGGPEAYVSAIRNGGIVDGRIEGAIGATIATLAVGGIIKLVRDKIKSKREQASIAEEKLKALLDKKGIVLIGENVESDGEE